MKKKFLAGILAASLFLSNAVSGVYAQETITTGNKVEVSTASNGESSAQLQAGDIQVQGEGSLGNMIVAAANEATAEHDTNMYYVSDVEITGKKANVTYSVEKDCSLVVAIYNDEGTQMIASASTEIGAHETGCTVEFNVNSMPETYLVKAFLLDTKSARPVGKAYTNNHYTKEFQEFYEKTMEDFPEERVMQLDDDTTTNFAVLKEETLIVHGEESGSEFVAKEDGTYVIENATKELQGLKAGDSFFFVQDEQQWMVVVGSIQVKGTTVTIEAAEAGLEDFFEYVKVEEQSNQVELAKDSKLSDGVTYLGSSEGISSGKATVQEAFDETFEKPFLEQNYEYHAEKSIEGVDAKATLDATLDMSFLTKLEIYYNGVEDMEISMSITPNMSGNVNATGEFAETFDIHTFQVPLGAGVNFIFTPSLVVEVGATLNYDYAVDATVGFGYSTVNGFINKCVEPSFENILRAEGNLYVGLRMSPGFSFIHEELVNVTMSAEAGVNLKASASWDNIEEDELEHECTTCVDGDVYGRLTLSAGVEVLDTDKSITLLGGEDKEKQIGDFYYSVTKNKGGTGTCPYIKYRTLIKVTDQKGNPLSGVTVYSGSGMKSVGTTDKNGQLKLYRANGSYLFAVKDADDNYITCNVFVEDAAVEAALKIATKYDVTVTVKDKEGNVLSGISIYKDGTAAGTTNSSGQLVLKLGDGSYVLSVNGADGQVRKTVTVNGKNGAVVFEIEPVDDAWRGLYREFLFDYMEESGHSSHKISLEYIDEDEVPELVIYEGFNYSVYVVWNGEVKNVGTYHAYGAFRFAEKGNLMATNYMRQGLDRMVCDAIIDGEGKTVHNFFNNENSSDDEKVYEYNGVAITSELFWAKVKEVNDRLIKKYESDFLELTESNILKLLGEPWQVAYAEFLLESGNREFTFSTAYVDEDDIPELFVVYLPEHAGRPVADMYTYYNGELCSLDSFDLYGDLKIKEKGNFIRYYNGEFPLSITYSKIEQGDSKVVHSFYNSCYYNSDGTDIMEYKYNGKVVSEDDFESMESSFAKQTTKWICNDNQCYAVTEANVKSKIYEISSIQQTTAQAIPTAVVSETNGVEAPITTQAENTIKQFTKNGLEANKQYLLLIVKDSNAENLLAADNILYIDQQTANSNGYVTFSYKKISGTNTELLLEEYDGESVVSVMPGDVDGNDKVDLQDAQLVLKAALKILTLEETKKPAADVNKDNKVGLDDAQLILKYALKIINTFNK